MSHGQMNHGHMNFDRRLEQALSVLAGVALMAMMFLTSLDVVGRYFFGRPVPGAFELTELLLVVVIFLAMPSLSWSGGQIETDALAQVIPPRPWHVLYRIARVFAAVCLAYVAWKAWGKAGQIARAGDTTSALGITLAPFAYLICGMTALACVFEVLRFFVPHDGKGEDNSAAGDATSTEATL